MSKTNSRSKINFLINAPSEWSAGLPGISFILSLELPTQVLEAFEKDERLEFEQAFKEFVKEWLTDHPKARVSIIDKRNLGNV